MENEEYSNCDEIIGLLTNLAIEGHNIFRGYSKKDQLLPSLVRSRAEKFEMELLDNFEKYAIHYAPSSNPVDFMANAQHFGLSTRLLDFTYNGLSTLF